jgi:hypothetical protein
MAHPDAHPGPLDLEFGQVIAFQQIDQFLNLLRVGRGLLGAFSAGKGAREDNGRSSDA